MAVVAREGLLASVRSDVSLEEPGPRESFATQVALAGQRMGADVHLEGSGRSVDLPAFIARNYLLEPFVVALQTMELLMLDQTGVG